MKLVKIKSGSTINAEDISAIILNPKDLKTMIVLKNGLPFASSLDYNGTVNGIIARMKDNTTDILVFADEIKKPIEDVKK